MKSGRPSYSAEIVASMRALEALRPADERICYDPYARCFLRGRLRKLARITFFRKVILRYIEHKAPGTPAGIAARTRYIDDLVIAECAKGAVQLVILGAGYDTRALRLAPLQRIRVFEVDFPDTQRNKREMLHVLPDVNLDHITYVPIDFNSQTLHQALTPAGYDPDLRTLFLWEGVTMYLDAEAVDATLAFIAQNTAAGSSLYFDYFLKSVMDGRCQLPEAVALRKMRSFNADGVEQFTFHIDEEELNGFLLARGFRLVEEMRGASLHARYFHGKNEGRYVHQVCGYVHCAIMLPEPV